MSGSMFPYFTRMGARHITFLVNGKVSYSDPVRQSLYTFEDSKNVANNYKVLLRAKMLKKIFPILDSKGFNFTIHLSGRTLIDESKRRLFQKLGNFGKSNKRL